MRHVFYMTYLIKKFVSKIFFSNITVSLAGTTVSPKQWSINFYCNIPVTLEKKLFHWLKRVPNNNTIEHGQKSAGIFIRYFFVNGIL